MSLDDWYGGRILNFAHRGASGHAPANTLAAFLMAAEMGADGIELDVHLSKDGEAVVIHDHTVDATTDGHGHVSAMTLSELRRLDAGIGFGGRFAGQRIPTLQEVFDAVGHRLLINVEIKVAPGHHPRQQEAEVVRLIEDNQLVDRVIVSSFSARSLGRVRRLNPNIALGLLHGIPLLRWPRTRYEAMHPSFRTVGTRYLDRARKRGARVHVWTVNETDDMQRMRDLGIDGIITNYPDRLCDVLAGR